MGKNNRMIPFLKLLMNHEEFMKSDAICKELHISDRTLRDDIVKFNTIFEEHGLRILSKQGAGYRLMIHDQENYHAWIATLMKEEEDAQRLLPVYPEDRINYLIKLLLRNEGYLKLDDIADQIFISRSTLQNDMKEVRQRLQFFHLELAVKPAYGIRIEGSEMHKRSCISQYFYHTDTMDDLFNKRNPMNEVQKQIRDILFETLEKMNFRLSDIGFSNLIIHITIAMQRTQDVHEDVEHYRDIMQLREYHIAQELVKRLNAAFSIHLQPIETCYIAIHLLGKKSMQFHREYAITQEIEELMQKILVQIKEQFHYDFTSDFELYTVMALHFQPLLNRLQYGLSMQNPLLESIKKENHEAFEMAVLSADVVQKELSFVMSEAEMGYLALHYALAIERVVDTQQKKKNIIVVCASGAGSSQILMYKLRQRFANQLNKTLVIEMYKLKDIDQKEYDFILTTVPIPYACDIPVIEVQYFLNTQDISQLSDAFHESTGELSFIDRYFHEELFFVDMEGKDKEDILYQMIERVKTLRHIPDELYSSVLEREHFASTEFGHMIAMPHPMKAMCDETFICVAVLKRPIKWVRQQVRFIFLMCVEAKSADSLQLLHETLSTLMFDERALRSFEKDPTIISLKQILHSIASKEIEKDRDDIFR